MRQSFGLPSSPWRHHPAPISADATPRISAMQAVGLLAICEIGITDFMGVTIQSLTTSLP